jgi:holo-[acyl-carrier protein] synthase
MQRTARAPKNGTSRRTTEQLGVGVDCEDLSRWRRLVPRLDEMGMAKIFSRSEHRYCRSFADPVPHYAGRWCAKEAVVKAASARVSIEMKDVHIERDPSGRPVVTLDARVPDPGLAFQVSIAHSREQAMAFAIAYDRPRLARRTRSRKR